METLWAIESATFSCPGRGFVIQAVYYTTGMINAIRKNG